VKKLVMTTVAALTIAAQAQQGFASAADPFAEESAGTPAASAPAPGVTRFITRGGETVEGKIIDRLPNGYLVRMLNDTTRVVAYEDVAAIEGAPAPNPAPPPPPPQPVYAPPVYAPQPMLVAPGGPMESPERFGRAGQIIIQQGFGFAQHTDTRTTLLLSPAIDFLVTDIFTMGFELGFSHSRTDTGSGGETSASTSSSTAAAGVLSLGLLFPVSRVVSLWPNIGGGIEHDFDGDGSSTVLSSSEFAVLFHPARHFFLALKPGVRGARSLEGTGQSFQFTEVLNTGIGGWW
jgi:hypothetical protein